jgi:hypothetical protein
MCRREFKFRWMRLKSKKEWTIAKKQPSEIPSRKRKQVVSIGTQTSAIKIAPDPWINGSFVLPVTVVVCSRKRLRADFERFLHPRPGWLSVSQRKPKLQCVVFKFQHALARRVCIAGSFNGWDRAATRMVCAGHGRWLRALFLSPGRYDYALVVDGQLVGDPAAKEIATAGNGGVNSVLVVSKDGDGTSHRKVAGLDA